MMKGRCLNSRNDAYEYYGGRGIIIDPRWLNFNEFLEDMGPKPDPKLTLERRDNNGNYNKENCYWGTRLEQSRNRRYCKLRNGKYTWEWAKELGLTVAGFKGRLRR